MCAHIEGGKSKSSGSRKLQYPDCRIKHYLSTHSGAHRCPNPSNTITMLAQLRHQARVATQEQPLPGSPRGAGSMPALPEQSRAQLPPCTSPPPPSHLPPATAPQSWVEGSGMLWQWDATSSRVTGGGGDRANPQFHPGSRCCGWVLR